MNDQREEFEKWAKDSGYALLKTGLNQYFYSDTGAAWDAWQAAQACVSQSAGSDTQRDLCGAGEMQGEAVAWACFGKSSLTRHFTIGSDGPEAERKMEALGFYSYETVPLYTTPQLAFSVPDEWRKAIQDAIDELSIMDESEGIAGWHLNGAISTWDESGLSAIRDRLSALLTTTPQPANWIPCSERLPTEADADFAGNVMWWGNIYMDLRTEGWDARVEPWDPNTWECAYFENLPDELYPHTTHWTPTGLTRPNPPEQESE